MAADPEDLSPGDENGATTPTRNALAEERAAVDATFGGSAPGTHTALPPAS